MKNIMYVAAYGFLILNSCGRREIAADREVKELKLHYDTTALDSFSPGAISVDVARKIRMSSKIYQDSLKEALRLEKEEKRIQEEVEKENKKLDADRKKAAEDEKSKNNDL